MNQEKMEARIKALELQVNDLIRSNNALAEALKGWDKTFEGVSVTDVMKVLIIKSVTDEPSDNTADTETLVKAGGEIIVVIDTKEKLSVMLASCLKWGCKLPTDDDVERARQILENDMEVGVHIINKKVFVNYKELYQQEKFADVTKAYMGEREDDRKFY